MGSGRAELQLPALSGAVASALSKGVFCAWQNMPPSLSSPASRRSGAGDLLLGPLPCLGVPDGRIIFVLCRRHCFPNGS